MKSKIKSVTIITAAKNKTYTLGETYNGLILHHIKDYSAEYEDSQNIEFIGFTDGGTKCFQAINCALDVQFEAVEKEVTSANS